MSETFDPANCTLETCSVEEYGQIQYIPTLAGNAIYAGIFGVILLLQLVLGIRYKTWGYLVGMSCGLILEIIGYIARILLHDNIFENNYFIIYLVGLTIGPAFLAAAIYLCLSRIITIFGAEMSFLKPRTITLVFIICDLVSLLLQSAGGAIASVSDTKDGKQTGINVMIAGLASQVVSLTIFMAICLHFAWRVYKNPLKVNPETVVLRSSFRFKGFLYAIAISVFTIMVRSIFRLIELQEGFNGDLANDELTFMILEGPMIIIAAALLTAFHPGIALGRQLWDTAGFSLRTKNNTELYKKVRSDEEIAMEYVQPPRN